MSAREEILTRLRAAVTHIPPVEVPRDYRRGGDASVDLLIDRLVDYRARVRRSTRAEVGAAVAACLADASAVVVPGELPALWMSGYGGVVLREPLDVEQLDGAAAVVTGCRVAIAATGTIILDGGAGQGRRALTLVPDHHVCVVDAAQIVAGLPEAVALLDPRRPQTWISGPSATSDIELQRVEGVHGPRRLDVIIVD
ncbi:lactate utilization protein C [Longispora fulva]|uniref:L-lactate dehydrogenase complex protein LldG n=1 Tax=Longispora fulva TaxID=619741 RepID=A0A8J7GGV5_9ACTN|nr:lactate utilization protein C [Longispora fulva]MBG6134099.1 L-lactate dehydrogenase complex protein LldG [Longispora fulva]GIG62472.1 lactate utilization protein C [Longispora fulva]